MRQWHVVALNLSQRKRLFIGALVGVAVGVGVALLAPWQLAVLAGWDLTALFVAGSIWTFIPVLDGVATRAAAAREDLSMVNDDFIILIASSVSLVGVVLTLIAAEHHTGALRATMIAVAVVTVFLSWTTVHTMFVLRYARLYYDAPEGGLAFPDESQPDYRDFAYLAFTVGMTFQVSDTAVSSARIRHTVTRHALLSFIFGTVIIGVTINVVGGLVS